MAENDERRRRILDACTTLLLKYGYDKTTVSDIAAEAGISKGAIYLHFPSKEALVEALIWRELDVAQQEITAGLHADPQAGSFFSLYQHSLRVALARPLLRAFFGQRKYVYGDLLRTLAPKFANARTRQAAVDFVAQYQTLGLIRADLDPAVVSFVLACIRYGFMVIDDVIPADDIPNTEQALTVLVELLTRGLSTPAGTGEVSKGLNVFTQLMDNAIKNGKAGQVTGEGEEA